MKKITRATFKSFINKNRDNLFIKVKSNFNSSVDGVEFVANQFDRIVSADIEFSNNYGIQGVWLVGTVGGNSFTQYESDDFVGISVYNSCGSFVIAAKVN